MRFSNTNTKIARGFVLALAGLVLYLVFSGLRVQNESVEFNKTLCVRSVCLEAKYAGDLCSVIDSRVSEIIIEADHVNSRIKNIRVIPSDDRCL